jgi:hypothetical protein
MNIQVEERESDGRRHRTGDRAFGWSCVPVATVARCRGCNSFAALHVAQRCMWRNGLFSGSPASQ